MNCTVKVRYYGGTYVARAGRGRGACTASSTDRPQIAARRAAWKLLGQNASAGWSEDDIALHMLLEGTVMTYSATIGIGFGGAS